MAKITLAFMQRFTNNLNNAIKKYVSDKIKEVSDRSYQSSNGLLNGYTKSPDITVSRMAVSTCGNVVEVMIAFNFNEPDMQNVEKILLSGFPVPKGEVNAIAMTNGATSLNNVYLNLTGNLVSRVVNYDTETNYVSFSYIKG